MNVKVSLSLLAVAGAAFVLVNACGPRVDIHSPKVILVTADDTLHKSEKRVPLQVFKLQSAGNSCLLLIPGEGVAAEFLSPSQIVIGGVKTSLDMQAADNTVQVFNAASGTYKTVAGIALAAGEAACVGVANATIKLPGLKEAL